MEREYKEYLRNKKNFWKKAHQKEYTKDPVNQIRSELTEDFKDLTTRNSMTLRSLGLVINRGSNNLDISEAGKTFLEHPYPQKILDEQVMKLYLDAPEINDRLSIPIAPMEVILTLLSELGHLTFEEYKLFICWINSKKEIPLVASLIKDYRNTKNRESYHKILEEKMTKFETEDIGSAIGRLYNMFPISSYIHMDENDTIRTRLSKKDLLMMIRSFATADFSLKGYIKYLTANTGWQTYSGDSEYLELIGRLKTANEDEKEEIIDKLVEKSEKLPNIDEVAPKFVELEIGVKAESAKEKRKSNHIPQKIDFENRDRVNRKAGDFTEKIVTKQEMLELVGINPELARKVEQVSLKSDSFGYDVLSFNPDGSERHIEVKAVKGKPSSGFRFFISDEEMAHALKDESYLLYIVFDYASKSPGIYRMPNPFREKVPGVDIVTVKHMVTVSLKK